MKPRIHLYFIQIITIFVGLLSAGTVLGVEIYFRGGMDMSASVFGFLFFGSFLLSPILFRSYVAPRLAAKCIKCGGKSHLKGYMCYTYISCGDRQALDQWGKSGGIVKKSIRPLITTNQNGMIEDKLSFSAVSLPVSH